MEGQTRSTFMRRLYNYGASNILFTVNYEKIFANAYLPSRIRYNHIFCFTVVAVFLATVHRRVCC